MQWIERLNCAVDYIERHLEEKIDYEKAAANCPPYHFIFKKCFFI